MRKPDLNSTLALIDKAKTIDELCAALHYFRERIEADHVAYRWVDGSGSFSDCSTLPLQWNDRYVTMGYHRIDPVISGCIAAFAPVDWRALDWSGRLAAGYRRDAIAFGVGNQGYSVPVRGPGGQFAVFSITKSCEDAEWDRILQGIARDLLLVAHYVNRRALEFERDFYALPNSLSLHVKQRRSRRLPKARAALWLRASWRFPNIRCGSISRGRGANCRRKTPPMLWRVPFRSG